MRHIRLLVLATVLATAALVIPAAAGAACPCTTFAPADGPLAGSAVQDSPIEVGMRFTSDEDGYITALRFFKQANNTGTHTGHLWSSSGTKLAEAEFIDETASGWQEAALPQPVAITAGQTYVTSYFSPQGTFAFDPGYFGSAVDNPPLHAPAGGLPGGNGVFNSGASGFPASSWNSTNYWIDAVFQPSLTADTRAPLISSVSPAASSGGAAPTTKVKATFDEPMDPLTVNSGSFTLRDGTNAPIVATVAYDAASSTATLTPQSPLGFGQTYTAQVKSGTGGVTDLAGNRMTADRTWTFSTPATCPCTIFTSADAPQGQAVQDQPLEMGVKFTSAEDGFITGLRFYKQSNNVGAHVAHLWSSTGQLLATMPFSSETASGWQHVELPNPVPVTKDTTYIASYFSPGGWLAFSQGGFNQAIGNAPMEAPASGLVGGNGVFTYGGGFPTSSFNATNYWVDAVFDRTTPPDTRGPDIASLSPVSNASDTPKTTKVSAIFDEQLTAASVSTSTFTVKAGSTDVGGSVAYDAQTRTATFTPDVPLAYQTSYTATLKGGPSGIKDSSGNPLGADKAWSFTTSSQSPEEGPGGPVLLVGSPADPFTKYYAEILRSEGLNAFDVVDAPVTAQQLSTHSVVLYAASVTDAEVSSLTTWVQEGGNLIALRPDKKLAGLLGLTDAAATLSEGYLKVDNGSAAGAGIDAQTLQFHGTADRYSLNGATAIATLYSSASTATPNPAVTLRDVGSAGGQAAAFTYDLARSVAFTRQGNPAWAGQKRDGTGNGIRPDDLFYGAKAGDVQADWVDPNRIDVPQADEQQRLLANLITQMELDKAPLPRFWYLPRGEKAAVVLTGDDHAIGGLIPYFNRLKASSPAGCSVADWECVRASAYMYTNTPITDAQVAGYQGDGFEIGLHLSSGCQDFTRSSLATTLASQLGALQANFPSIDPPVSNRTHCIVWSDWASQPKVERDHGIRFDTNYYYLGPAGWLTQPGLMTGSGFPQRFADTDGSMIDVYQAMTQVTDESDLPIAPQMHALLNNALGSKGYYGAFTVNMHTDYGDQDNANNIVDEAQARGVPVVSAAQMLKWTDGRNGSSFSGIGYSGNQATFSVVAGQHARGLQGMIPASSASGPLMRLSRDGTPIPHGTRNVKGIDYATFDATAGNYVASYATDTSAPDISAVSATADGQGRATVSWTTDEPATSIVSYGRTAALGHDVTDTATVTAHVVELTGLAPGSTFSYRVRSADIAGNTAMSPTGTPATLVVPAGTIVDNRTSDFAAGTASGTFAGATLAGNDGEVQLKPAVGEEFATGGVPATWTSNAWSGGGSVSGVNGDLVSDGAVAMTGASFDGPRTVEFAATLPAVSEEAVGLGNDLSDYPLATFSTERTDNGTPQTGDDGIVLYAWSGADTAHDVQTQLPGVALDVPHRFRIVWNPTSIAYYVDGSLVATHAVSISVPMRPVSSDFGVFGAGVRLHWLRQSTYATSGTLTSRVLDSGPDGGRWTVLTGTAATPSGTSISYQTRSGSSLSPDGSWSAWQSVGSGGTIASATARYIQYRATLTSTSSAQTPTLQRVDIGFTGSADRAPNEGTVTIAPSSPTTNQTVTASATGFTDPDGDPVALAYQWFRDGTPISGATSSALNLSPAGNGDRGDKISVEVYGRDNRGGASDTVRATVTVAGTAPGAGSVSIKPTTPSTNDTVQAVPTGFTDVDGDTLTYRYQWLRNGTAISGATSKTLDLSLPNNGSFGDTVAVDVTAVDGSGLTSAAVRASKAITGSNSTPVAGTVAISPASPKTLQTVTATPSGFREPDGQAMTYRYQWYVNDTAISGATASTLDLSVPGRGDRGDKVRVDVTASDPQNLTSDPATTTVTVANSAPGSGTVTVKPTAPASDDVVSASTSGFSDADGDAISYQYQWYKNGTALQGATGRSLDLSVAGNGEAGDTVAVDVTALDGHSGTSSVVHGTTTVEGGSTHSAAAFGFEEAAGTVVSDESGAPDGTMIGGTRVDNGKFGRAIEFNGKSDYVSVPDDPSLHLTTGMTLEAWVKPAAVTDWRTIIFKDQPGYLAYSLYADGDGQQPGAHIFVDGRDADARGPSQVQPGVWTHLAATYDGTTLRMFVGGRQVGSRTLTGEVRDIASSDGGLLTIGGNAVWGEWFKGLIDEVRVYNRPLTATQITADMDQPVVAGTPAPPQDTSGDQVGQFSSPSQWPVVSVHSALTNTGKVVVWDGFDAAVNSERLWDPATGRFERIPNGRNLFCAGHVQLRDGRLLVVGGHASAYDGLKDTNLFDPADKLWTRGQDMSVKRWYPTATELSDGRVFVVSGDAITLDQPGYITPLKSAADTLPSIYDPVKDSWTDMPQASRRMPLYPFIFLLPDGRLFDAGPDTTTRTLNLGTGQWTTVGTSPIDGQSAVMYRPGKILKSGTWSDPEFPDRPTTNAAAAIDMTVGNPSWRTVSPMKYPRSFHTLTVLPDGNVLATGGQTSTDGVDEKTGVLAAEMWNPNTDKWTVMASHHRPRLYHSTSLLLPDGRVLLSGGGAYGAATDEKSGEIYSPPYLFKGPRPTVTMAPSSVNYAQSFSVATPDAARIQSVSMVKLGAVTHNLDMGQRFIPLNFTQAAGGLSITGPSDANLAPPGSYMVFLVDSNGVPSIGEIVQVGPVNPDATAPSAPTSLTAIPQADGVHLNWSPATDNVGVVEYRVYRSSIQGFRPSGTTRIASVSSGSAFTDTDPLAGRAYYRVIAVDAAGNTGAASPEVSALAGSDVTAPTVSVTAPTSGTGVHGVVTATADAADAVSVTSVQFRIDGAAVGAADTSEPYSLAWETRSVPDGPHTISAVARDAAGNTTVSAGVSVTVDNTSLPQGLVAAYGFEESSGSTVTDTAGGHTGDISGATRAPAGKFGKALIFNGTGDSVSVPDSPALNPSTGFTIESWVSPSQLGGWRSVVAKEQPSSLAYALYAGTDFGNPAARLLTDADMTLSGTAALPLDEWSHLAMTWDGPTATLHLYVDGTLVNTRIAAGEIPAGAGPLRIGGNAVFGEWFKGMVDEVRVYGRALSASEVQADMNTPIKP